MMGTPWNLLPMLFAPSPPLSLRMLPPQVRRPLRARRRHPDRGRRRPFPRPPQPPGVAPSRLGQPLRCLRSRTDRRGSPTGACGPPSARWRRLGGAARLRGGHERVASVRCRMQPRARILLPSIPPLGGAAHRGRLGLPVPHTTELRPRELDCARGCKAPPSRPRRQRGRYRAGELVPTTTPLVVVRGRDRRYSPVRLRRGLRSRLKVQQGLEGCPCQILLRLRAGRRFYGDPSLCDPPEHTGGPRRHGPKMKCNDPSTWPEPSAEHRCEDAGYGSVVVRAWAEMHPKVDNHAGKGTRGPLPIVVGTLVLVEVERLPRGERRREPRVLWLWWHGPEGTAPDLEISSGALTSGASTWSTPSASSSRAWDGLARGFATPNKPSVGVGWWWPHTRS